MWLANSKSTVRWLLNTRWKWGAKTDMFSAAVVALFPSGSRIAIVDRRWWCAVLPLVSRQMCSQANLGAEPKNRVEIDVKVIYHLWVSRGNFSTPSRILGLFIAWLWIYWELGNGRLCCNGFCFPFSSRISMWLLCLILLRPVFGGKQFPSRQ